MICIIIFFCLCTILTNNMCDWASRVNALTSGLQYIFLQFQKISYLLDFTFSVKIGVDTVQTKYKL